MRLRNLSRLALVPAVIALLFSGCKNYQSYWVNVSVLNLSGETAHELEIDYPSASFGINSLAPGATYNYRLKISGSGKIHAQFAAPLGETVRVDGPVLQENQQGNISIQLLPRNQVLFNAQLTLEHGNHFAFH